MQPVFLHALCLDHAKYLQCKLGKTHILVTGEARVLAADMPEVSFTPVPNMFVNGVQVTLYKGKLSPSPGASVADFHVDEAEDKNAVVSILLQTGVPLGQCAPLLALIQMANSKTPAACVEEFETTFTTRSGKSKRLFVAVYN